MIEAQTGAERRRGPTGGGTCPGTKHAPPQSAASARKGLRTTYRAMSSRACVSPAALKCLVHLPIGGLMRCCGRGRSIRCRGGAKANTVEYLHPGVERPRSPRPGRLQLRAAPPIRVRSRPSAKDRRFPAIGLILEYRRRRLGLRDRRHRLRRQHIEERQNRPARRQVHTLYGGQLR
jgi:hypothetical protein